MKTIKLFTLLALAGLSLFSCKKSNDGPPPPSVTNNADNFTFQATNSTATSGTYDYSWTNTGQTATVSVSSSITTGTANVVITDASGTQVYTGDIQTNGSFVTSTGVAGTWKIHVTLSAADGKVSFTVVKH